MGKEETLTQLSSAKKAHIAWVTRARALIEGLPIEQEQIPVNCTDCKFGLWFYGDGQRLNRMSGMSCLKEIEALHMQLHETYMQIFKIYFSDTDRSFFAKLFGTRKKISPEHQETAKENYRELKAISEKLIAEIERLERRLFAMPAGNFS